MHYPIKKITRLINAEAWKPLPRKKHPLNPRSYLWQIIRMSAARASMASWGLPFEAIAASILLKDRNKKRKKPVEDDLS